MKSARTLALASCSLMFPYALTAQLCVGSPALAPTNVGNVGVGASFFDGGNGYSVGATFGGPLYGTGGFTFLDFDDTDLSLKGLGGEVGYAVSPAPSVGFCPSVGVTYGFGLEILGIDFTTLTFAPAVAVGIEAEVSPTITVVPFGQGRVLFQRVNVDAGPLGEESASETNGSLILGLTFIFNGVLGIGPAVRIPVATEGGDTTLGVFANIAFGGSR